MLIVFTFIQGGWTNKTNTVIKAIKHNIEHSPYNFILWEPLKLFKY